MHDCICGYLFPPILPAQFLGESVFNMCILWICKNLSSQWSSMPCILPFLCKVLFFLELISVFIMTINSLCLVFLMFPALIDLHLEVQISFHLRWLSFSFLSDYITYGTVQSELITFWTCHATVILVFSFTLTLWSSGNSYISWLFFVEQLWSFLFFSFFF